MEPALSGFAIGLQQASLNIFLLLLGCCTSPDFTSFSYIQHEKIFPLPPVAPPPPKKKELRARVLQSVARPEVLEWGGVTAGVWSGAPCWVQGTVRQA